MTLQTCVSVRALELRQKVSLEGQRMTRGGRMSKKHRENVKVGKAVRDSEALLYRIPFSPTQPGPSKPDHWKGKEGGVAP